jgi:Tfp pilus assembly protein PilW
MITTTTHFKGRCGAFTLVEVLIGATLGTMVLAGVLSTFLMLGRSGANIANYSMMEAQSRRALEDLSQDIRMGESVTWTSAQSITIKVPHEYSSLTAPITYDDVKYAFNSTKGFYRVVGIESVMNPGMTLVRNVSSCTFERFDRVNNATTSPTATKRIKLTLVARIQDKTVAAATNTILSASYILRNKPGIN